MIEVDCWRTSSWRQNFEPCFFFRETWVVFTGCFFLWGRSPPRDRRAYSLYGGGGEPRGIIRKGGYFLSFHSVLVQNQPSKAERSSFTKYNKILLMCLIAGRLFFEVTASRVDASGNLFRWLGGDGMKEEEGKKAHSLFFLLFLGPGWTVAMSKGEEEKYKNRSNSKSFFPIELQYQ